MYGYRMESVFIRFYRCLLYTYEAAVFLYQTDEENYKVSTRSASYVDVAKIAAKYGGGGHVRAAGFSVAGDPEKRLNEIIEDIREQITD